MQRQIPKFGSDAYLDWGNDLVLSSDGDLLLVTGAELSKQRVIRRLLTAINTYIWHPDYGAGLPAYVGEALSTSTFDRIRSLIKSQIALESSVAQTPVPIITFQTIQSGLLCEINYVISDTLEPVILSFNINPLGATL